MKASLLDAALAVLDNAVRDAYGPIASLVPLLSDDPADLSWLPSTSLDAPMSWPTPCLPFPRSHAWAERAVSTGPIGKMHAVTYWLRAAVANAKGKTRPFTPEERAARARQDYVKAVHKLEHLLKVVRSCSTKPTSRRPMSGRTSARSGPSRETRPWFSTDGPTPPQAAGQAALSRT
jgi:hypothetical protein